jgi:hypothetical protein
MEVELINQHKGNEERGEADEEGPGFGGARVGKACADDGAEDGDDQKKDESVIHIM